MEKLGEKLWGLIYAIQKQALFRESIVAAPDDAVLEAARRSLKLTNHTAKKLRKFIKENDPNAKAREAEDEVF
jgi:hypothetical protein